MIIVCRFMLILFFSIARADLLGVDAVQVQASAGNSSDSGPESSGSVLILVATVFVCLDLNLYISGWFLDGFSEAPKTLLVLFLSMCSVLGGVIQYGKARMAGSTNDFWKSFSCFLDSYVPCPVCYAANPHVIAGLTSLLVNVLMIASLASIGGALTVTISNIQVFMALIMFWVYAPETYTPHNQKQFMIACILAITVFLLGYRITEKSASSGNQLLGICTAAGMTFFSVLRTMLSQFNAASCKNGSIESAWNGFYTLVWIIPYYTARVFIDWDPSPFATFSEFGLTHAVHLVITGATDATVQAAVTQLAGAIGGVATTVWLQLWKYQFWWLKFLVCAGEKGLPTCWESIDRIEALSVTIIFIAALLYPRVADESRFYSIF